MMEGSDFFLLMVDTAAIPRVGWYDKIQGAVYSLLESPAGTSKIRKAIIFFIATLILLNIFVIILETENSIYLQYHTFFSSLIYLQSLFLQQNISSGSGAV